MSDVASAIGVRAWRLGSILIVTLTSLLAALGLGLLPSVAAAGPSASVPMQSDGPVEAVATVLVTEMSAFNLATNTFNATFYLSLSCDQICPEEEWDILNAQSSSRELIEQKDGTSWWRVQGTFTFDPQLQLFPFDTQYLEIEIEHRLLDADQLVFVPNPADSEVTSEASISGWETEAFTFTSSTIAYRSLGQDYSRMTFTVPVTRSTLATITKYYVPLAIFIFLGAATLVLRRYEFQIGTGGSALVGLTVFYLATSGGIGNVGYLTVWDLSVLLGYLALGLVLISGVIGLYLTDRGTLEEPDGDAIGRRMRNWFLAAFAGLVVIGALGIVATGVST